MARVPISGATKAVWQRYCQAVGVDMGEGVALLMLHELSSVAGEDAETLADRLNDREAEMNARARELKGREKELKQRDRTLFLREAYLEDREKEVAAREQNVAVIEQNLAQQLRNPTRSLTAGGSKRKLGRNEPCWCGSGKKYKGSVTCHKRELVNGCITRNTLIMLARAMATSAHPSLPFDETPDPPRRTDDGLLSVEELSDYLEVPVKTIYTWRHHNTGPKGFRVGKHLRFRWADVQAWVTERLADEN